MRGLGLLLRWSWRDLRANWIKVAAIALVIAIGTGSYAGLTSTANWRRMSNEASYRATNVYDVRVELAEGTVVPEGDLASAAATIEHAEWLVDVEERMVFPTLVDASTDGSDILVPGLVIGTDPGHRINTLDVVAGRNLTAADSGSDVVVLEHNFARYHELPAEGSLRVSGERPLDYVGNALQPEYFVVVPEGQLFFSERNYAVLFTSLETAQRLAGRPGEVNGLVVTVGAAANPALVGSELEEAADAVLGVGAEAEMLADDTGYQALTNDVENDQQVFNMFAVLLFAGAVTGAFNLISRLVEQGRREIGTAMALGTPAGRIAVRPLLVGAQISLLGVLFGVGVGILISQLMRSVLVDFLPLPIWETPFQPGVFAGVALVGFLVPLLATSYPVWRAVRVKPVDAIRPLHLTRTAKKRKSRVRRLPGDTFAVMPFRNLVRARRRTVFTVLAIGAVMTVLVGFLGMVDSFLGTLDDAEAESLGDSPDRMIVELDTFYAADSPEVTAVVDAPTVSFAEPGARIGGIVSAGGENITTLLELLDMDDGVWTPSITAGGVDPGSAGLILAEEAARDLGVEVGDTVTIRFPVKTGEAAFALESAEMPVSALHPYPLRNFAYMDMAHGGLFGLEGSVNLVQVIPAEEATPADVTRNLLEMEPVSSVQQVSSIIESVRDEMGQLIEILTIVGFFVFVVALLIAFNAASINLDERLRDHATMFAFGVPVHTALRMAMTESFVIGLAATTIGVIGGLGMLWWITSQLLSTTLPDFGVSIILEPQTLLITILLGIVAVACAPVFTVRRMRRMDLPGTLRLME